MIASIDQKEIEHFSKDSDHWWDEEGPFAPLHKLNPQRLTYIRAQIEQHYNIDNNSAEPFKKLKILDIGCGGGLVCEPMARLSGNVTGIDADENAIAVATGHAKESGLKINYQNKAAEQLLTLSPPPLTPSSPPLTLSPPRRRGPGKPAKNTEDTNLADARLHGHDDFGIFDIVLALEIIEHVADVDSFVKSCVDLCKPGGLVIFSTLNRTPQSFALGIVAAEYIMRWVPKGTHQWGKFIRPAELARMLRHAGATEKNVTGLRYNPVKCDFELSDKDISVNYFITAGKPITT